MSFADKIKAAVGHPKAVAELRKAVKHIDFSTPTKDGVVDLGAAIKKLRSRCEHKNLRIEKGGRERCNDCGDAFPCGGDKCFHLDCIEQRHARGIRRGFPRDFPHALKVLGDRHGGDPDDCAACSVAPEDHFEYMVDPTIPPERWILPFKLEPR